MPVSVSDELVEGTVFRLARVTDQFPKNSPKPLAELFRPSTDERRIAEATRASIRLSVFNAARTTIGQARNMRRADGETVPFALLVEKIREFEIPGASRNLRVIPDPFAEIKLPNQPDLARLQSDLARMALMPGAAGHCGIEGLGDDLCIDKRDRRNLRAMLRKIAFRLPDDGV